MKVRIISSKHCQICKGYLERLAKRGYNNYELYDADNPANSVQLDEWKVRDMPVVHITDDDGNLLYPFPPGPWMPALIEDKMESLK